MFKRAHEDSSKISIGTAERNQMGTRGVEAVVGLVGLEEEVEGLAIVSDRVARIRLPERFDASHVEKAKNDLEIFRNMFTKEPEKVPTSPMRLVA